MFDCAGSRTMKFQGADARYSCSALEGASSGMIAGAPCGSLSARDAGTTSPSAVNMPLLANQSPRSRREVSVAVPGASKIGRHTSELQSLMRNQYAVFCLKKNHN